MPCRRRDVAACHRRPWERQAAAALTIPSKAGAPDGALLVAPLGLPASGPGERPVSAPLRLRRPASSLRLAFSPLLFSLARLRASRPASLPRPFRGRLLCRGAFRGRLLCRRPLSRRLAGRCLTGSSLPRRGLLLGAGLLRSRPCGARPAGGLFCSRLLARCALLPTRFRSHGSAPISDLMPQADADSERVLAESFLTGPSLPSRATS